MSWMKGGKGDVWGLFCYVPNGDLTQEHCVTGFLLLRNRSWMQCRRCSLGLMRPFLIFFSRDEKKQKKCTCWDKAITGIHGISWNLMWLDLILTSMSCSLRITTVAQWLWHCTADYETAGSILGGRGGCILTKAECIKARVMQKGWGGKN